METKLRAHHVYVRGNLAVVDGVGVEVTIGYSAPEPDVGWDGGVDVWYDASECFMHDLAHWDEEHPGVEPTKAAMMELLDDAGPDIEAQAADEEGRSHDGDY